eukprot:6792708-Ditylum_brightwellii.AAC.1
MPEVVKEATRGYNFNEIEPSKAFKTCLEHWIKRKKLNNEHSITWRDNDAEYTSCIWEWLRHSFHKFPYHTLALKLAVLTQLSSCSVKRVFSRLKLIRDVCGNNMILEMLELHLILQCNEDLYHIC